MHCPSLLLYKNVITFHAAEWFESFTPEIIKVEPPDLDLLVSFVLLIRIQNVTSNYIDNKYVKVKVSNV